MRLRSAILFFFALFFCDLFFAQVTETVKPLVIDESKSTIRTRFTPPPGFTWVKEEPGSFGDFLVNFPLHPPGFPIRDYKGVPLPRQHNHLAILKIDVGEKDLQQCADAWMRLYAEYLWGQKRYDEIGFHFTSGQFMSWNDFKNGVRTTEVKDRVKFHKTAKFDDSYQNFRKYLNLVFNYAGTISLDREGVKITNNNKIQTGDFLINPGSPGHSVFIVGVAKNRIGKKVYLLAESFMPAQDIHILKNPTNKKFSPWYELDVNRSQTITAKYLFKPTVIKRFHALVKEKTAAAE